MKTTRHAVLCLLLAFAVASVHATLPPGKSARWDARELANRMLAEESVPPVLDPGERDRLATRVRDVLKKIRARHPAMGAIRARMRHHSSRIPSRPAPATLASTR